MPACVLAHLHEEVHGPTAPRRLQDGTPVIHHLAARASGVAALHVSLLLRRHCADINASDKVWWLLMGGAHTLVALTAAPSHRRTCVRQAAAPPFAGAQWGMTALHKAVQGGDEALGVVVALVALEASLAARCKVRQGRWRARARARVLGCASCGAPSGTAAAPTRTRLGHSATEGRGVGICLDAPAGPEPSYRA